MLEHSAPAHVEVVAHRGMGQGTLRPDQPPENTLPSLEAAWAAGVDACEVDVHLSSDGHLVVIHDDETTRTAGQQWSVHQRTFAELRGLDVGRWKGERWTGARVPELGEVLATIPDGKRLFIELKVGPVCVPLLARAIAASGRRPDELPIISFGIDTITAAKEALPAHQCHLLAAFEHDYPNGRWVAKYAENHREVDIPADIDRMIERIHAAHLDGLDASFVQPRSLTRRLRAAGLESLAWTVNEPEVAVELAQDGVTSITSDFPEMIRATLAGAGID